MDVSQRGTARQVLSTWLQGLSTGATADDPIYIRNKVAQLFSVVFAHEYPERWPSFFSDFFSLIPSAGGTVVLDVFFRVLLEIDALVVDREFRRTQAELDRNTCLKDAMRTHALSSIAEIWMYCTRTYATTAPELVNSCLKTVAAFVPWIEIGLVANEHLLGTIFAFARESVALRVAAVDVVREIVLKGMDGTAKTQMLASLDVVRFIREAVAHCRDDDENEYMQALAQLYNSVGMALLDAIGKVCCFGFWLHLDCLRS